VVSPANPTETEKTPTRAAGPYRYVRALLGDDDDANQFAE
jgi:hypothetical protein